MYKKILQDFYLLTKDDIIKMRKVIALDLLKNMSCLAYLSDIEKVAQKYGVDLEEIFSNENI